MTAILETTHNFPALISAGLANSPFLTCDDGRSLSRQQFWDFAGKLASALALAGAKPQDRIAVQVDKSIEAIALFYACLRGGFVFLPLNTAYTASEVEYFVTDAEPTVVVCAPGKLAALSKITKGQLLTLDATGGGTLADMARLCPQQPDASTDWNSLAAILYTSGTTGRSKGAMLTQANLASNALALVDYWKFTASDKLIHALPVYHTHGLFTATNTVLLSGGELLYRRTFDAADVLKIMPQATTMMGVPTFYTRLLAQAGLTRASTQHMRLFISGSAPLLAETHKEFERRTGHAILERYGMTETSMNTSNPYDGERRAGTVGFPLPGISARINAKGVIEIKGPNVFAGYWRNPEKTKEDMTEDGWFITGDVGHFDADGYLVISGRAKDLIISGGFNVYPKEVELLLDVMPDITESAVIGVPHKDFGEAVVAVIATSKPGDETEIIRTLKEKLANFKVPKRIIFIPELPRNAMGKVQKAVLRETYQGLFEG